MENKDDSKKNPEIRLDKKSKMIFAIIGLLIAGSVAVTFWRYMIKTDYISEAQTDCDPETENCFIWECDPNSLEEGEKCTGVPDEDIWYYKIVRRNAKNIPLCDPNDENCDALTCPEEEKECEEILCTPENVGEGEVCSNPEQYLLENPPEEDACEEGDEECLSKTECEEGDEECEVAAESEECALDDEECDVETEEECAPDDEECLSQAEQEDSEKTDAAPVDENAEEETPQKGAIPSGVEPM